MSDLALLGQLLEPDKPTTVDALAGQLGWAEDDIRAGLTRLADRGCEFEDRRWQGRRAWGDRPWGVRLVRTSLGLWADYLEHRGIDPGRIRVYRSTPSTQDAARSIGVDGTLVLTGHQTAGRGRMGRRWLAPEGSAVLMSRVHGPRRPGLVRSGTRPSPQTLDLANAAGRADKTDQTHAPNTSIDQLTVTAAVAVARTLDRWLVPMAKQASIKWPNDVLIDDRKIAGILVETAQPADASEPLAVIGLGVNVELSRDQLPDDLRQRVTSLSMLGIDVDRLAVVAELIDQLDRVIEAASHQARHTELIDEWRRRSTLIDRRVRLQSAGQTLSGTVVDLDPVEGLILRTDIGQLTHVPAAHTHVLDEESLA